jgi:hypothetical protein
MKNKSLRIILPVLLFACSSLLHSQDLIVTRDGDTLNCKITSMQDNFFYVKIMQHNTVKRTLLPLAKVKYFEYNYFNVPEIPAEKLSADQSYPHFKAAVTGGLSFRLAKIGDNVPSELEQYMKELKSGYHAGFDAVYYFHKMMGVGLKYDYFNSKNKIDQVYVTTPDGSTQYGELSDNISVIFLGPSFNARFRDKRQNTIALGLGIGYVGYQDKGVLIRELTIKGNTIGICWDAGYDFQIADNWSVGFQLSIKTGMLTRIELDDGVSTQSVKLEEDSYEDLYRIDLSIGIRFNK